MLKIRVSDQECQLRAPDRFITSVVGRIRNKPEVDDSAADAVLSLNIISAKYLKSSHNSSRYVTLAFHITVCKPCLKQTRIHTIQSVYYVCGRLSVYRACMKGLLNCLEFRRGYEHESLVLSVGGINLFTLQRTRETSSGPNEKQQ